MSYDKKFWSEYHSQEQNRGAKGALVVWGAGALVVATVGIQSCSSNSSPETTIPTTTTAVPETSTTTTTTTTLPPTPETSTTTTLPKERFSFTIQNVLYDCVVLEPAHSVVSGDNIWKIVEEQNMPEAMPQRWIGTIELNQQKGTVGSNPNLIFPGDAIFQLVDCVKQ